MKRTAIVLCTILLLLTRSFSQKDTSEILHAVLPLQITSIDANVINKNVQLLWTVSSNEDAKSFEVERADDGGEFKKIGGKLSFGNTGSTSYEFVDAMPGKNIVFSYRVKILAKDGSFTYSDLRSAKVADEIIRCKLKQNPVRNAIEVEVVSAGANTVQVSIYSNFGQKAISETVKLSSGVNHLSYSSQNLVAGIHRLVLESGSERKVISFVKE